MSLYRRVNGIPICKKFIEGYRRHCAENHHVSYSLVVPQLSNTHGECYALRNEPNIEEEITQYYWWILALREHIINHGPTWSILHPVMPSDSWYAYIHHDVKVMIFADTLSAIMIYRVPCIGVKTNTPAYYFHTCLFCAADSIQAIH